MGDVAALEVLWFGIGAGEQERSVAGDPYSVESQHDGDQYADEDQHWSPGDGMIGGVRPSIATGCCVAHGCWLPLWSAGSDQHLLQSFTAPTIRAETNTGRKGTREDGCLCARRRVLPPVGLRPARVRL